MLTAFPDLSTTAIVCISAAIMNHFKVLVYKTLDSKYEDCFLAVLRCLIAFQYN